MFRVLEACGLTESGLLCGYPDPYCQVALVGNAPGLKSEIKRGSTRKRTFDPLFQDTFSFPVSIGCGCDSHSIPGLDQGPEDSA